MAQIISDMETEAAALAWLKMTELVYKSPYIPVSPLRPSRKQIQSLAHEGEEQLYGGGVGGGKLQRLTSKIMTPKGWRTFGELKVGDVVSDPVTGGSTRVIQIFPQGKTQIYRVTCDDGATCEVGLDHLWSFKMNGKLKRRPGSKLSSQREFAKEMGSSYPSSRWDSLRVGTTQEIMDSMKNGVSCQIPLCEPLLYTVNGRTGTGKGSLDPYLIGVLLGDGSLGNLTVTSCDDEIRDFLVKSGFHAHSVLHKDNKPKAFGACGKIRKEIRIWLANNGLKDKRSFEKFIPQYIMTATIEYRLAVVQGLMDTDGTVDERGRCSFTSVSESLASSVRDLIRGLGGKARVRKRQTNYTYKGEKKAGLPSFTVHIWMRKSSWLFRMDRKKKRCLDRWNGGAELMRNIVKIEPSCIEEAMCIKLSSPYGLYVTDDFIVTHNSDAILMGALMYATVPGYSALILRRTFRQLAGDGGLIPRSKEWIGDKAKFRDKQMQWQFPSGATITFGYFDHDDDRNLYLGGAWQYCAWDEATLFKPAWYEFMFSRLRKADWICTHCQKPLTRPNFTVQQFTHKKPGECDQPEPVPMPTNHLGMSIADVPIRMRAASNPGGPAHDYFKRRFVVPGAPKFFIKSLLDDNPGLDKDDYKKKLEKLDPVTRAQYLNGDWDAYEGGRFKKNWFREFWVEPDRNGNPVYKWSATDVDGKIHNNWPICPYGGVPVTSCWQIITVDPAASNEDKNDYTVIGVFSITPNGEVLVLEVVRERMSIEEIIPRIERLCAEYDPQFVGIEDVAFQTGIVREGQRSLGVSVERLKPEGKGKLVRATPAIIRASEGQIFIPKDEPRGKFAWLDDFLAELICFTGDEKLDSHDDVVDVLAYAIMSLAKHGLSGPTIIQPEDDPRYDNDEYGIFMSDNEGGGYSTWG